MPLVHVIGLQAVVSQGPEHHHAPEAQHDLLTQPIMAVAAVQMIGQGAIPG
jgi:hypothetical protein